MSTGLVFTVLIAFITFREIMHYLERKDLYNRIMAKNLSDYSQSIDKKAPKAVKNLIKKGLERGDS